MIHYPLCLYYIKEEDIDRILDKSPLFRMLYNVLLEVRESGEGRYVLKVDLIDVLNEIYAQAIRIVNDRHPESDFYHSYIEDVKLRFTRSYEADLVFSGVYYILSICSDRNKENIRFALKTIENRLKNDIAYFKPFRDALNEYYREFEDNFGNLIAEYPDYKIDFTQHVDELELYDTDWTSATNKYDQATIEAFVKKGQTKADRRLILQTIAAAYADYSANPRPASVFDPDDLPF